MYLFRKEFCNLYSTALIHITYPTSLKMTKIVKNGWLNTFHLNQNYRSTPSHHNIGKLYHLIPVAKGERFGSRTKPCMQLRESRPGSHLLPEAGKILEITRKLRSLHRGIVNKPVPATLTSKWVPVQAQLLWSISLLMHLDKQHKTAPSALTLSIQVGNPDEIPNFWLWHGSSGQWIENHSLSHSTQISK